MKDIDKAMLTTFGVMGTILMITGLVHLVLHAPGLVMCFILIVGIEIFISIQS